jgi:anti-anti-sigma regulatory factor
MCADADGHAVSPGTLTLRLDHLRAGVPVVHASGCLDQMTAPGLQHVLDEQLTTAPWAIVVDLSALSVLEPDAVPTLVHVACRAGEADIGLCLVTAGHTANGALGAAAELFEIYPTTGAALRALS